MKNSDFVSDLEKLYVLNPVKYVTKVVEELAELQVAFLHYLDGKVSKDEVMEEAADVTFQIQKVLALISKFDAPDYKTLDTLNQSKAFSVYLSLRNSEDE